MHVLMSSETPDLKAAVIAALTEAFKKETVKPALDSVTFRDALTMPFSIATTISLMPGFGEDHRAAIEKNFRTKFEAEKRLRTSSHSFECPYCFADLFENEVSSYRFILMLIDRRENSI